MPHINRIRLVDVAFNDAKSFYDDFIMVFNQKSATFDLENGGGKSVLLMMLLQVVLPNVSLREDKPFKNIFLGGKDRTSHVLVEWSLDEGSPYKYLLTGFCARKSRSGSNEQPTVTGASNVGTDGNPDSDAEMSAGVEYFNYTHLYDRPNDNDIREIPLTVSEEGKRKTMSFDKLKDHLRQLNKKNKPIDLFDRRGEYISFIKQYNLIDTEWKIIKEINSGENSIEKYFRQNKTSRKLIENLLIKIIEDTGSQEVSKTLGNSSNENALADALIEIRENLNKFLKDKQHLSEYEKILTFYNKIKDIDMDLKNEFEHLENLKVRTVMNLNKIANMMEDQKNRQSSLEKENESILRQLNEGINAKECLDIQLLEFQRSELIWERDTLERQQNDLEDQRDGLTAEINQYEAQNNYLKFKNEVNVLNMEKSKLESLGKDQDDLLVEYKNLGFNCKTVIGQLADQNQKEQSECRNALNENEVSQQGLQKDVEKTIGTIASLQRDLDHLNNEKKEKDDTKQNIQQFFMGKGLMEAVLFPAEWRDNMIKDIDSVKNQIIGLEKEKTELIDFCNRDENIITRLSGEINLIDEQLKRPEEFIKEYRDQNQKMNNLLQLYDAVDLEQTDLKCSELLSGLKSSEMTKRLEYNNINKKLDFYNRYEYFVPNDELLVLKEKLKKRYQNVFLGTELLQDEEEEAKRDLLTLNKLLPYSVVLDGDSFKKFQNNRDIAQEGLMEYPVPVIDLESVRSKQPLPENQILFISGDKEMFIKKDSFDRLKEDLRMRSRSLHNEFVDVAEKIKTVESDLSFMKTYKENFDQDTVQKNMDLIKQLREKKDGVIQQIATLKKTVGENRENLLHIGTSIKTAGEKATDREIMLQKVLELMEINKNLSELEKRKQTIQVEKQDNEHRKALLVEKTDTLKNRIKSLNEQLKNHEIQGQRYQDQAKQFLSFDQGDLISLPFDELFSLFNAKKEVVQNQNMESESIRKNIQDHEGYMREYEERIKDHGFDTEYFKEQERQGKILVEFPGQQIRSMKKNRDVLSSKVKELVTAADRIKTKIAKQEGAIHSKKQALMENKGIEYQEDPNYKNEEQILEGIKDTKMLIDLFKDDLKKCEEILSGITERIQFLSTEQRDMIHFINTHKIDVKTDKMTDAHITYNEIVKAYSELEENIDSRKSAWRSYVRSVLVQGKDFYINDPVKVLEDLEAPASLTEVHGAIRQMEESVDIIDEKMVKIKEDIEVLEKYQEQFNTQCIHRAEWILERLKKFPSLSRIELNGTTRNMIESRFFDYSEEDKNKRMKNHIESIIREINNQPEIDKTRIASRLSSKELLAQITDMDKATLRLYKVESMEEHSGYKRWEHAVGSEGQSNALYFIFAVCLIAYIRMLSLNNTQVKSKKVIIADNPFGATSAVYLWEPMFNILAENDVQLIAPGHRINKELTSKFEVNYLLNQEVLADNRIRVVVKDVRTEEDLEQMNFDTVEQMKLF